MTKNIVTSGEKFTDIDALACAVAYSELLIHHTGFETYWHDTLGEKSHIEFIGACATLIWEEYRKRGQTGAISILSRQLLSVGILSNTLNFGAQITDERDRQAFDELQAEHPLSEAWREQYFSDQEQDVRNDIANAIVNDTKVITDLNLSHPLVIGQLELWDGSDFLEKNTAIIKQSLESFGSEYWFMSIPSLKEKRNQIYTENSDVKALLSGALDITFEGHIGTTEKLWLRKEILKKLTSLR